MIIAVPKESFPGETRVALTPSGAGALAAQGIDVVVEAGAGNGSWHSDDEYCERNARVLEDRGRLFAQADIVVLVRGPGADPHFPAADLECLKSGTVLVGFLEPLAAPECMIAPAERGLTLFSMELIPRITRAQRMDTLSSMATLAGYAGVILAAQAAPRMFPLMMTAAGTFPAAKVLVIGAGVAGLQAIATARRLGAVVEAYDLRPAVREQVQSLGARFLELNVPTSEAETGGGYAREQSDDFYRVQRELLAEHLAKSDVVITTAAVPGKRAPILISADIFDHLRPGSVIVDLAAEKGGNCELTKPGETIQINGVTIIGSVNVAAGLPVEASLMYSRNVSAFLELIIHDGQVKINKEDAIIRESMVAHEGKIVNPAVLAALRD